MILFRYDFSSWFDTVDIRLVAYVTNYHWISNENVDKP